jgi:hypothetical protein
MNTHKKKRKSHKQKSHKRKSHIYKKKKLQMNMSQKKYKQLLSLKKNKKKMSIKDKKLLNDALYVNYCKCLIKFKYSSTNQGYPICMNSIYNQRGIKYPKNASKKCSKTFK